MMQKSLVLSAVLLQIGELSANRQTAADLLISDYEAFRAFHRGESAEEDSVSYGDRLRLFHKRVAQVQAINSQPHRTWKAGLNRFADWTEAEFKRLLGRRHGPQRHQGFGVSSLLEVEVKPASLSAPAALATSVDWREKRINSTHNVKQQGACGSCWAVSTVGALEVHAEINMKMAPKELSFKHLVDCTPNKKHCGGEGGCKGATSELAFEQVKEHGVYSQDVYTGNINRDDKCRQLEAKPYLHVQDWHRLPTNKLQPLMEVVAEKGPAVGSVDASGWSMYSAGVFSDCVQNATVNHAILILGYGHDQDTKQDYWLIRNSWGKDWGEQGFIRVKRHSSDEGDAGYCGWDNNPKEGVGCDGGPPRIPVCGECGILSDSAYPVGVTFATDETQTDANVEVRKL
eukprot:TRINITY_DN1065_c0_g1_i2.p1 TRINITY_DN1065_c0_g1~~TRINITY_DN1065_c0_g1_i2.p1  ORF type:complete len:401 (+),score=81.06 TRINITY_DN1065_c0_g1_i2:66-1268(+)